MSDEIIAYTKDGRAIYDNTPTVVAVAIVTHYPEVLVIKRATNPGKGLYALPGGFHMRGETWQEAGAREVFEEVGLKIDPRRLQLINMETDSDGHNVVIAGYYLSVEEDDNIMDDIKINAFEVLSIDWLHTNYYLPESPTVHDKMWAFPLHYQGAMDALHS